MSNRARRRPRPKRVERPLVTEALTMAGCTCRADVRHLSAAWVELAHERGCPAIAAGRMIAVRLPPATRKDSS